MKYVVHGRLIGFGHHSEEVNAGSAVQAEEVFKGLNHMWETEYVRAELISEAQKPIKAKRTITMNKAQRKSINDTLIGSRRALEDLQSVLSTVAEEEQEKFDNMSEGLQASPTGQAIEEKASETGDIVSEIEDLVSTFDDLISRTEDVAS